MIIRGATRTWPEEPGQVRCFSRDLVTSHETGAMSVHYLRIEPNGEFKAHAHDDLTELHFVVSGRGQAQVGDTWENIAAGDVALALPGVGHALRNISPEPLFILCVFTPPLV